MSNPYLNPLVEKIEAELEAVDGMVDNMIAFVLRHAAQHLYNVGGHWCDCCRKQASAIDPDTVSS